MTDGIVTSFDISNGFGLIQPDDGSKPIFVHITTVRLAGFDRLTEGQKVSYERLSGPYGSFTANDLRSRS